MWMECLGQRCLELYLAGCMRVFQMSFSPLLDRIKQDSLLWREIFADVVKKTLAEVWHHHALSFPDG